MPPGPAKACLFDTAPQRTGRRGRPALKGRKLGRPAALATDSAWGRTSVYRYGRTETVQLAQVACLWYGSFGNTLGRSVLVREPGSTKAYDLALITLDQTATPAQIVERYRMRWSIEPANAVGKQQMGPQPDQERRRAHRHGRGLVRPAGHHPDDALARRLAQPWYQTKTQPSFEDMITKLRKTLIVARFTPASTGQPTRLSGGDDGDRGGSSDHRRQRRLRSRAAPRAPVGGSM